MTVTEECDKKRILLLQMLHSNGRSRVRAYGDTIQEVLLVKVVPFHVYLTFTLIGKRWPDRRATKVVMIFTQTDV